MRGRIPLSPRLLIPAKNIPTQQQPSSLVFYFLPSSLSYAQLMTPSVLCLALLSPGPPCTFFCRQCVGKVKYSEAEGPYGEGGFDDYFLPCFTGVGTHIDGLAHYGKDNLLYNGVDALNNVESFPIQNRAYLPDRQGNVGNGEPELLALNATLEHQQLKKLGTHLIPPIVTRGVVIDLVPVYSEAEKGEIDGVEYVLGGTVITPEKIQEALDLQGMTLQSGDAALIHTGWANLFRKDKGTFLAENPGLGVDAARFLTCHEVVLVGIDQWCGDQPPSGHTTPLISTPPHVISIHGFMPMHASNANQWSKSFPPLVAPPPPPHTHTQTLNHPVLSCSNVPM